VYGKWHVGEGPGRWPTDKGFEEWYGPPRTYDEALWPTDPWYQPGRDPESRMVEIKKGEQDVTEGERLTLDVRRDCDVEYLRRATAFIKRTAETGTPFFVYFNHSLMHMPVIPRAEFKGKTGQGDWADSLVELDSDFGALLDLLDELKVAENTLVVFAGDNGPEEVLLWRGSPGYWEGSYFAGGEGNLRTPCIVRWPGRVPGGRVSNEIMHVTDWFTTILRAAGLSEPEDREIDGVNQLDWLTGQQESPARDGYVFWMGPEVYGVKWRNFKLALIEQKYSTDPVGKLSLPRVTISSPTRRSARMSRFPTSIPGPRSTSCGFSASFEPAPSASHRSPRALRLSSYRAPNPTRPAEAITARRSGSRCGWSRCRSPRAGERRRRTPVR
jgi:arylsulfatase